MDGWSDTKKNSSTYPNDDSCKARSLLEVGKVHFIDLEAKFLASNVWFHRFKSYASVCLVNLSSDATVADIKAAESYPESFRKTISRWLNGMANLWYGWKRIILEKVSVRNHSFRF